MSYVVQNSLARPTWASLTPRVDDAPEFEAAFERACDDAAAAHERAPADAPVRKGSATLTSDAGARRLHVTLPLVFERRGRAREPPPHRRDAYLRSFPPLPLANEIADFAELDAEDAAWAAAPQTLTFTATMSGARRLVVSATTRRAGLEWDVWVDTPAPTVADVLEQLRSAPLEDTLFEEQPGEGALVMPGARGGVAGFFDFRAGVTVALEAAPAPAP
jgi:hypothetical protein